MTACAIAAIAQPPGRPIGSERFNVIFAENLRRYRAGEPLIGVVDWEKIADGVMAV